MPTECNENSQDPPCLPVTVCAAGEFETAAPTETSDRVCGSCAAAEFLLHTVLLWYKKPP